MSRTKAKKKLFWKKVDGIKLHKIRKKHETKLLEAASESPEGTSTDGSEVDQDDGDSKEVEVGTSVPKVKLVYGDDYEEVRGLPRRRMKKTAKRRVRGWIGKAYSALAVALTAVTYPLVERLRPVFEDCGHFVNNRSGEVVDLLELFAGCGRLTEVFAQKGYTVLEPRDILYGHDLFDEEQQNSVFQDIAEHQPRLLWIALPCTKWCAWQHINYHGRKQALRRERQKQRRLIRFAKNAAYQQLSEGGMVVFEHPRTSEMWDDPCFLDLVHHPLMVQVDCDLCQYNLRSKRTGELHLKPTRLLCSDVQFAEAMHRKCPGGHTHAPVAGGDTRAAGMYTKEFARAVTRAYERAIAGSVWSSYVVDAGTVQVPYEFDDEELVPDEGVEPQGAEAISFDASVPKNIARVLRRVHQNLGHPRREDLVRHLRLAGASDVALKAAQSLECQTCRRHVRPPPRRPGKLVRPLDFNQDVGLDLMYLYTVDNAKITVLSMLDHASGYHVVRRVTGRKSSELADDFLQAWVGWAGAPRRVVVDQERGLMKEFTDELEKRGIQVHYIAAQAHWQNSAVERQNGWFRAIWEKVVDHQSVTEAEAAWALAQVSQAKNSLRREHGYSPTQWLFGSEGRVGDPYIDGEDDEPATAAHFTPHEEWHRKQEIRWAARRAFVATQAEASVRRAIQGRPRVQKGSYEVGDWVYLYRSSRNPGGAGRGHAGAGGWIGPGTVVGREGASYWVARGGRCLLCAQEHLRPAESEELGTAFQTKVLKEDLMRLVNNLDENPDDDELFLDARVAGDAAQGSTEASEAPKKRMRAKGPLRGIKRKDAPPGEDDMYLPTSPEASGDDGHGEPHEAFAAEGVPRPGGVQRVARSDQKQQDKEIKWHDIPEKDRPLYQQAEVKQWKEHVDCEAVEILSHEQTEMVLATVPRERILKSRFAYRDKNVAKRREDPTIPAKPKARLCIAGHMDPDIGSGQLLTEAPTATKMAFTCLLVLSSLYHWNVSAGDVEAAFLNGNETERELYMEQPVRGLPGVASGVLIRVRKGIFGLCNSPRLWWERLSADLLKTSILVKGVPMKLVQHPLDACLFLLRGPSDELHAALITHVDDLLLAGSPDTVVEVQQALSKMFPIAEWEKGEFDYIGSQLKQGEDGTIHLGQRSYVNSRLESVNFPKPEDPEDLADPITRKDNQSTIGALSWLAAQTRPDLQSGVSMSQRKQKHPTFSDVKETNGVVRLAQKGKDYALQFPWLDYGLDEMVLLVFHDAAWANAVPTEENPEVLPEELHPGTGIYSQLGHVLILTRRGVLEGRECGGIICLWRSHACPRVCRSTFAAETMSALEGIEQAMAFRAMLAGALYKNGVSEATSRSVLPVVAVTDCKSVFDAVHRLGGPKAPSEKRLMVDLAGLRQLIHAEERSWGHKLAGGKALRWVPTSFQLADILTKSKADIDGWWRSARTLRLPFDRQNEEKTLGV